MTVFSITNETSGITFNVRAVRRGEMYGRNNCIEHCENIPLVEFYDARFPHSDLGQFVTRYYQDTLLAVEGGGLSLDGGIPAWTLTEANMREVRAWLQGLEAGRPMSDVARRFLDKLREYQKAGNL